MHIAEAVIITCIDFRLQEVINNWIAQNFEPKTFDRVALGGGVKNLDLILGQVKIANDFHHIKKVFLINHEDCKAYGAEGAQERHSADLKAAAEKIKSLYPNLNIQTFYLHLDGTFESVS